MKILKLSTIGLLLALTNGFGQAPAPGVTAEDRAAIQALMGQYSQLLSGCRAAEFADLFLPDGSFASGFRGRMVGRERLMKLVESERQCTAPAAAPATARTGGANGPAVVISVTPTGVHGVAALGTAEYIDEYTKTPQGWRFASRTVVMGTEKAAGLEPADMLALERLAGAKLADHYEPDANGVQRLMTSGLRLSAANGQVTGRVYLQDGTFRDEAYEKLGPGQWRVKPAAAGR
jgi:hypothetical protein